MGALPGGGCLDGGIRLDAVVELLEAQRLDVVAGVDRDAPQDSEGDAEDPVVSATATAGVRHCTVEPFNQVIGLFSSGGSTNLSFGFGRKEAVREVSEGKEKRQGG